MKKLFLALSLLLSACNFVEIDPGKFYRSPQLNKNDLERVIYDYKIKTVINLRGPNPGKYWYDDEKEVTARYGILQIDIPMSSGAIPHRKNLLALLDAYRNAPRPILVHCLAGVDRTGEAAAIYEMVYTNKSKEEALEMLSLKYGYSANQKPAKRYFIKDVWQSEDWAYKEYDPCSGKYQFYDSSSGECAKP